MKKTTKFSAASSISIDAKDQKVYSINKNDWISKLPDDVLHTILSRLSTKEAVKTSIMARRWVELWKYRPSLELDMRKLMHTTCPLLLYDASVEFARSITKVIKNHCGDLKSCIIHHYKSQCHDTTLKFVIQLVTRQKKAKELTLVTYNQRWRRAARCDVFRMEPDTFSDSNLTSLSLCGCIILRPRFLENCSNLKTLKLINVTISRVRDVTKVLVDCSSLEVIVLELRNNKPLRDPLKIENKMLKYIQITFHDRIDSCRVDAASLVVVDIRIVEGRRNYGFFFDAPNIGFSRHYFSSNGLPYDHVNYNICSLAQEKRSVWHELLVSGFNEKGRRGTLSVIVDPTNPKDMEIFKEILLMWNEMKDLEIVFKRNNDHVEEGENKLWNDTKPFPYADFRVQTLWLYNFDSTNKEELTLVTQFVTHKMVTKKMMVEMSRFSLMKRLNVKADLVKLWKLSKCPDGKGLPIHCI